MSLFGPPSPEKLHKRMMNAVEHHDLAGLEKWITAGADPHTSRSELNPHWVPLYRAVHEGFNDGLTFLIAYGCDPHVKRYDGHTTLMEAANTGNFAAAKMLIEKGVDVNAARTDDGMTALHLAASRGRGDVIKLLLQHNADINATDHRMNTPADLADKDYPRLADLIRGKNRPPEAAAPVDDTWVLTAKDEVSHITDKPAIGYRLTEIFNFGDNLYTRIARNLETQAESQSMCPLEQSAYSALRQKAEAAFIRAGGERKYLGDSSALDKKPLQVPTPQAGR